MHQVLSKVAHSLRQAHSFHQGKALQLPKFLNLPLSEYKQTFNQEQLDEIMLIMYKETWGFLMCGLSILNMSN